jgi:hypothetical protein
MLAGLGVIEIVVRVGVTVRVAVPLTPLRDAATVVAPAATALARPEAFMVATEVFELAQLTLPVRSAVEPSLYLPIAVNCWVVFAAMLAVAGKTAMEVRVAAGTGTVTFALALTPFRVAVTVAEPDASAVARPAEVMVAIAGIEEVQDTVAVTFAVEPSLYVAVAANCWVAPAATVAVAGETAIDVTVFVAAGTVSVALPLTPSRVAVIVVEPAATAFAMPDGVIVATAAFASVQFADAVTSAVEPSL